MLKLRDLALAAPDGRLLLSSLNVGVRPGGNLLLTGPTGCGKSRLLKVIAGTERPRSGSVSVGGIEIWPGKGSFALTGKVRVGLAFARGGLLANQSLKDNVALPLRFLGLPFREVEVRVMAALEQLGITGVAGLRPHAVSDTARKHANLARVLALEPALILLDDPLAGLEASDGSIAQDLIQTWAAQEDRTLVIVAEDAQAFAHLELELLVLAQANRIVEPT